MTEQPQDVPEDQSLTEEELDELQGGASAAAETSNSIARVAQQSEAVVPRRLLR